MKKLLFLFCATVFLLPAQDIEVYWNRQAEDYFLLGMRQYNQKDFKSAVQTFQNSIASGEMNHRITASTIMKAKTLYGLRNFSEAASVCGSFIARFPSSAYKEDAHFTRGMCFYNLGLYRETVAEMETVLVIAQQWKNQDHAVKMIEHVAFEFLAEAEIDSIIHHTRNDTIKGQMSVTLAERYFSAGDNDRAKTLIENVAVLLLDPASQQRINRLRGRIERGNLVRIGVLLPFLSSSPTETRDRKVATEVLEGIQLALSDYEENVAPGQVSVELKVRDSERRSDSIRSAIASFTEDDKVVGIIGPIFSDEAMAAASAAHEAMIPLVSPTATDDSITQVGDFAFLANSTSGMRGKILAQYAVKEMGGKNIAILASEAQFSKAQADSFAAEAIQSGATIVADRRYSRGAVDLREHFKAIRSAGAQLQPDYIVSFKGKMKSADVTRLLLSYGIRRSAIDSVLEKGGEMNITPFVGARVQELADTLKLPYKKTLLYIDSLHYPVSTIDIVFSPINSSQQIGVISSQLAYYNIKAAILGTSEWYNIHELDMNRRYADGATFGSDRWIEQEGQTKRIFATYSQKYGKQANDNVLFGFDVMSLMIQLMNDGALTREQMKEALTKVVNFTGIRNTITFTQRRVNGSLHILQYKNGVVSKLRTYTYQE
ncbi:MAG: ABC transporter substrate-binding protein [Ignavibacteriales bacterium]|nr:ABC transporter substrate-binding protein [Ignavibacteriales bacterium]